MTFSAARAAAEMDQMIERVTRAILEAEQRWLKEDWPGKPEYMAEYQARAAIKAML